MSSVVKTSSGVRFLFDETVFPSGDAALLRFHTMRQDAHDGPGKDGFARNRGSCECDGGIAEAGESVESRVGIPAQGSDDFVVQFEKEQGGMPLQRGLCAAKNGGLVSFDINLNVRGDAEFEGHLVNGGGLSLREFLGRPAGRNHEITVGENSRGEHVHFAAVFAYGRANDGDAIGASVEASLNLDHPRGGGGRVHGDGLAAGSGCGEAEETKMRADVEQQHVFPAMADKIAELFGLFGIGDLALIADFISMGMAYHGTIGRKREHPGSAQQGKEGGIPDPFRGLGGRTKPISYRSGYRRSGNRFQAIVAHEFISCAEVFPDMV